MQAHRSEVTLSEDGVVIVRDLPFQSGESVEIIILQAAPAAKPESRYSLRGTPVKLLEPTEPVAPGEWEAEG